LKVISYRNGDAIPKVTNNSQWENLTTGAYCNYNNDDNNADTYGCLYNWYTVNESRNIAPEGWHVPSDAEWKTLASYLGGDAVAGGKMKESGTMHWANPGATNESGFSALPGGFRRGFILGDGGYVGMGYTANFWSSTEGKSGFALNRYLSYSISKVYKYDNMYKASGYSVRCVRD